MSEHAQVHPQDVVALLPTSVLADRRMQCDSAAAVPMFRFEI